MTVLREVLLNYVDCVNRTAPETPGGEYFAVGTPAMRGNVINFSEARRIDQSTFDTWTRRLVPREGDILLAREAPVGPVVRVPPGGNIAAGQRTLHLRPDPSKVDGRYLFYYLQWPSVQAKILGMAMGSTVPHLRVADAETFPLEGLLARNAQEGIGQVLGALDDKIAVNSCAIDLGRELLRTVWRSGADKSSRKVRLGDVVAVNPHVAKSEHAEPAYVDMKALPARGLLISEAGRREAKGGARFMRGDTLMARITPCFENGKMGYVDVLDDGEIGYGSTEFIVFRSLGCVPSAVPYAVIASTEFREFAARSMIGTSGRQRVQAKGLDEYELDWPDDERLAEFGEFSEALLGRLGAARDENLRLAATRDELLPLLMSGRITVKDAEKAVEEVV